MNGNYANAKPIRLSRRTDLDISSQSTRGIAEFVVHDPLTLENHRFNEHEFALLELINGCNTADDIKQEFDDRFAPYEVSLEDIESNLISFQQKNLLASTVSKLGSRYFARSRRKQLAKLKRHATSLLSIQFRGINLDAFLSQVAPWCRWFFSPVAIALNIIAIFVAIASVVLCHSYFLQRLPSVQQYFNLHNFSAIIAIVILTKILHEFGHGIVQKLVGGRCHEMGIMLFYFMPTLYVNTSDSWKLSCKWKRAAVAIAGIYVEITLAAFATFVWWYTHPCALHYVALNTMLICSFSAVIVNLNPFVKGDGYFLFSDLLELPNLQARSKQYTEERVLQLFTNQPVRCEPQSSARTHRSLLLYSAFSFVFRLSTIAAIAFVLIHNASSIGLGAIAKWIGCSLVFTVVSQPLIRLMRLLNARRMEVNQNRLVVFAAISILLFVACFIPVTQSIRCSFTVQPYEATKVYSTQRLTIEKFFVEDGEYVQTGDPLFKYEDFGFKLRLKAIEGELAALRGVVDSISTQPKLIATDISRRRKLRSQIEGLVAEKKDIDAQVQRTIVRATSSGKINANWISSANAELEEDRQQVFEGWTLDSRSKMVQIPLGSLICTIGDPAYLAATVLVSQRDVAKVRTGQSVFLQLESDSADLMYGEISSIAQPRIELIDPAAAMVNGGDNEVTSSSDGANLLRPAEATFEATVLLPKHTRLKTYGVRGTAKIIVGRASFATQVKELLYRYFRFT
jgi:putative peptide zinc metalloprotease protein